MLRTSVDARGGSLEVDDPDPDPRAVRASRLRRSVAMPEATDAAAAAARRAASAASDRRRSRPSGSGRVIWSSTDERRLIRARLASTSRTRESSDVVGEWEEEDVENVTLDSGASASALPCATSASAASRDASRAQAGRGSRVRGRVPRGRGDLLADVTASAAARIWRERGTARGAFRRRVARSGFVDRGNAETGRTALGRVGGERDGDAGRGVAPARGSSGSRRRLSRRTRRRIPRCSPYPARGEGTRSLAPVAQRRCRGGHRLDNARFARVSWRSARAQRGRGAPPRTWEAYPARRRRRSRVGVACPAQSAVRGGVRAHRPRRPETRRSPEKSR